MVAIRISNALGALRAARTRAPQAYRRTFITTSRFQAQGYGDAKGGPVTEDPKKQPESNQTQQSSEHPGPQAPDVGQKGNTATKGALSDSMKTAVGEKSPEDASAQSGGSRSMEAKETGSSPTGGKVADTAAQKGGEALKGPQGKDVPRPKIFNQAVPGSKEDFSDEQKQEVEQHNREFEEKHDKAEAAPTDKVDKKYWKGT
ncbi:hypothetical protein F5Y15DRAFT_254486 [Xylariaceae sp. FL0016]|nr:hypothetical protein F5Y15DRAFT_254486 [Xylariaceae sp. FL0016]